MGIGSKIGESITLQDSRDSSGDSTIHLKWPEVWLNKVAYNPLKLFDKNQPSRDNADNVQYKFKICGIGNAC